MKKLLVIIALIMSGCSHKYEVVQKLGPGRYHLYGVRNHEVIILITKLKLEEGQIVKWKHVKQ